MDGLSLLPLPAKIRLEGGHCLLSSRSTLSFPPELAREGEMLAADVKAAFGWPLRRTGRGTIELRLDPGLARLGEEGSLITIEPGKIVLASSSAAGVYWATHTLRQLMPPAVYGGTHVKTGQIQIPCGTIEDQPRFGWRGVMLDSARYYKPVAFVKRLIDLAAMHKLNRFHWHLTDDQGWRLEIRKHPRLTEIGAWRKETIIGRPYGEGASSKYDGEKHGGFYTQEEVKDIVRYASDRHIVIVPEIEMPGHAQAAGASYPQYADAKEPLEVFTSWGISDNIYNVKEETFQFLFDVLDETIALFPSPFIHVGGDEVPKKQWKADPHAQEVIKREGLKNEEELQSWFIRRIDRFLTSRGRRLIGWDEILEGGLAEGAAVMSWRGMEGGLKAAEMGHDVVMAPTHFTYLDYYQTRNTRDEPLAIGGFLPLRTVYSFEPVPDSLPQDKARHILGGQAQLWSEYMRDERKTEYMAFPRLCALAEAVWSPKAARDWEGFRARLAGHVQRLDAKEVNCRALDEEESQVIAVWKSGEQSNDFAVRTWDISDEVKASGPAFIVFQYESGGCRLDVEWIEIVLDGKAVQRIDQYGITGNFNKDNRYAVEIPKRTAGSRLELRASTRGDGGGDSNGEVLLVTKA